MRILVCTALFALAACGQPGPATYPPTVEINFMRACEAHSQVAGLCACVWGKIEADVAPADLAAVEALPESQRAVHPLTRQVDGYAMACRTDLLREPAPAP